MVICGGNEPNSLVQVEHKSASSNTIYTILSVIVPVFVDLSMHTQLRP